MARILSKVGDTPVLAAVLACTATASYAELPRCSWFFCRRNPISFPSYVLLQQRRRGLRAPAFQTAQKVLLFRKPGCFFRAALASGTTGKLSLEEGLIGTAVAQPGHICSGETTSYCQTAWSTKQAAALPPTHPLRTSGKGQSWEEALQQGRLDSKAKRSTASRAEVRLEGKKNTVLPPQQGG